MAWLRLDDGFIDHPKVLEAGAALGRHGIARVCAVFVEGLTYASRKLTDGRLSMPAVRAFKSDRSPIEVAGAMVEAGLWERNDTGYQIHDYLDFNISSQDAKRRRMSQRDRKRTQRVRERDIVNLAGARSPSPSPSPSDPKAYTDTVSTADPPPANSHRACSDERDIGLFAEWWREAYQRHQGSHYVGRPSVEWLEIDRMLSVYGRERLQELATVFLSIPDEAEPWLAGKTRTIAMFRSRVSACEKRLNEQRRMTA